MLSPAALLALLGLALTALALPAAAQELPPRPAGPVYDGADILSPADETALDQKLRSWTERSGRPIVVATVPTTGDETIEMYAANLYEKWGIGPADTDQGVLLLVAKNDRKMRIEVGYGLTPYITDILSGRIIRNDISPRFKAGDFVGGINAGVDALITQLSRAPEDARAVAQAAEQAQAQERESGKGGAFVSAIFWIVMILVFVFMFGRGGRGRRYRRGGTAGAIARDVVLWSALSHMSGGRHDGGGFGGGGFGGGGGGGGGFGGFGGGISGGGGASGGW
ncbi:YgcG family protein [Erythrobacter sp. 3-20A1M]|uniref:TPM domain-containing protein n=1 Tax=Erythrobacter sp. 3-20A1M TaxID=2653850 RepID=UPI00203A42EE|nr:TPM domain-containing protein [Erythrobacter sp. 3-20A1M]